MALPQLGEKRFERIDFFGNERDGERRGVAEQLRTGLIVVKTKPYGDDAQRSERVLDCSVFETVAYEDNFAAEQQLFFSIEKVGAPSAPNEDDMII